MQALSNTHLIGQLTRREIASRYRGSALGWLWAILPPLFLLLVYTWIFSEVFKARWGNSAPGDKTAFALNVFAAMIFLQFFTECLARAPGLMLSNSNYVKKVVFPLETLPVVTMLAAGFNWLVGLGIWLVFQLFVHHGLLPTAALLPLVALPLAILTLGLSWMLAALGAYLRDISAIIQLVLTLLTFVSPVFYPVDALPHWLASLLYLNPLTLPIEFARAWLLGAPAPTWYSLAAYWAVALGIGFAGQACFRLLRKGFADVL